MIDSLYYWLFFLVVYVSLNTILAYKVYTFQKKFYQIKSDALNNDSKDDAEYEKINIHDTYPEFRRYDELSFFRIFIGIQFIFWIRSSLMIILSFTMFMCMKILFWKPTKDITPSQMNALVFLNKLIMSLAFIVMGIRIKENRIIDNETYSKFLGPGKYENFEYDYSLIVSNHISWFEILYYMKRYSAGFISKATIKDYIFIGLIAIKIDCLFLDRTIKEERDQIINRIKERQESYLIGDSKFPLVVFPEGTVTSGKHILKFKKGAFQNLLPIKPVLIKDLNTKFSLTVGVTKFIYHYIIAICYVYHDIEVIELPIIKPTEYMYTKYSHYGKTQADIYSEVVRSIYSELGDLEKSDKQFRDTLTYMSVLYGREITNT